MGFGDALLMTGLIQPNVTKINEMLVDSSARPMTEEERKAIEDDPNAHPVDNMLPDGRYLVEDLVTKQNEIAEALIEQSIEIRAVKNGEAGEPIEAKKAERTIAIEEQSIRLPLWEVDFQGKKVLLPRNPKRFPMQFVLMLNGERLLVYNEHGLWSLDATSDKATRLTNDRYEGLTIEQLKTAMAKERPMETLYWVGGGMPSQDGKLLAYSSNRQGWKDGNNAIFAYDIETGEERLVVDSKAAISGYSIVGWLDNERILCESRTDNEIAYSIIEVRGEETGRITSLKHQKSSTDILDVRDGNIVYATKLEGDAHEYAIAQINEQGTAYKEVAVIPIAGWIRIQNRGLSPAVMYSAFIYVPNDVQEENQRFVSLTDLVTGETSLIKEVPGAPDARIRSFGWVNDSWLALELDEATAMGEETSTWLYKLKK